MKDGAELVSTDLLSDIFHIRNNSRATVGWTTMSIRIYSHEPCKNWFAFFYINLRAKIASVTAPVTSDRFYTFPKASM